MSARIEIRTDVCTGCGLCTSACPFGALSLVDGTASVSDACTLCGACESSCPFGAILIRRTGTVAEGISGYSGTMVIAESREGAIDHSTLELLGAARAIAEAEGGPVSALLFTSGAGDGPRVLAEHGADVVVVVEDPALGHYLTEPRAAITRRIITGRKPAIVLAAATTTGRDLMPRVAKLLNTGLTADCTSLSFDSEKGCLLQTRPAFGGNIMATIVCEGTRPQMATVRPRVMKALEPDPSRTAEIVRVAPAPGELDSRVRLEGFRVLDEGIADIAEASVIVSGGRGMKTPENFSLLSEIAGLLGGSVGASRAAVDSGWIPYPHQVGQTGKTVQPRTYLACGISGAVQHRVGMQSSDTIIAVNRDETAPIFQFCSEGFVGDLFEILPALAKEIRRRRGSA
ncbi:MAG: electron transfer flavoprotein subunit alpha [Candidatus Fermentibacter sp.]|nr:electron transfer flavoprotein subunit alpha [Candidatus Fermentibacter sp.]